MNVCVRKVLESNLYVLEATDQIGKKSSRRNFHPTILWYVLCVFVDFSHLIFFLNGTAPMFPSMFSNKPINQTKLYDKVQINFSDSQEIVEFPIYICHIKTPSIICQKSELYFVLEVCKHVITQERKKVTGDPVTERADSHEECKWQQKG